LRRAWHGRLKIRREAPEGSCCRGAWMWWRAGKQCTLTSHVGLGRARLDRFGPPRPPERPQGGTAEASAVDLLMFCGRRGNRRAADRGNGAEVSRGDPVRTKILRPVHEHLSRGMVRSNKRRRCPTGCKVRHRERRVRLLAGNADGWRTLSNHPLKYPIELTVGETAAFIQHYDDGRAMIADLSPSPPPPGPALPAYSKTVVYVDFVTNRGTHRFRMGKGWE
jgi:hypothetical protein